MRGVVVRGLAGLHLERSVTGWPRRSIALVVMFLAFVGMATWQRHLQLEQPVVHTLEGYTMGSTWRVNVVARQDYDTYALRAAIEQQLAVLDRELSGYRATAALARFNASKVGEWQRLPPHLATVLRFGQQLHRESDGAFDLSVKALVNLWGFGAAEPRSTLPSVDEIATARAQLGSAQLEFATDGARARRRANVTFDVDAIAPGHAADSISALLKARALPDHMVDIGGELRLAGHRPDGATWRIGIEQPAAERGGIERVIAVTNTGVATSGDYRDFLEIDGRRYSHTIDPSTGRPIDHGLASVTVLAPTAMAADGYATVLMVLGPERGMAWAEQRGLGVYMLVRDGKGGFREAYNRRFAPVLLPRDGEE